MENEYYKKVDSWDSGKMIDFTLIQKSIIENKFGIILLSSQHRDKVYFSISSLKILGYLVSLEDEWYIFYDSTDYMNHNVQNYLCDQFDGLLKCIEDVISKNK